MHLAVLEDRRGDAQVFDAAVGARADVDLVEADVRRRGDGVHVLRAVGEGHLGFELADVPVVDGGVGGVGVAEDRLHGELGRMLLQVPGGGGVGGDEAVLAPRLDGHVGHGHAGVHGQGVDGVARPLHGHVAGAVDAQLLDGVQDEVLAGDPGRGLAVHDDLQRLRHLEPDQARGGGDGGVGGADAGAEAAEGAVGHGVGVGADDHHAGGDQPLLREQGVFDAAAAHLEVVLHAVLAGEVAGGLGELGGPGVFGGDKVVVDQGDAAGIPDPADAELFELGDRQGGRALVHHQQIHLDLDQVRRLHLRLAGVAGQDFGGGGHTHLRGPPRLCLRAWRSR